MPAPAQRSGHIVELQSLRGIASVAVMIGHALNYYAEPDWFHSLALVFNGRAAVVVFFVLSGYVLTRSLRNARFDRATVIRFYVQRVFRIYPAIWAASALGLIYLFALHWQIPVANVSKGVQHEFRADRMDTLHIVASLAGMLAFILPQLWSIFIEIVASVAMPGIAFVVLHRRRWFPGLLAAGILISYASGEHTYYNIGLYFMDFIVGAWLAMPNGPAATLFRSLPARPLFAVSMIVMALTQFLPSTYYSPTAHLIETALSAWVIGLLVFPEARIGVMASRPLLFIGDVSFSIYLLHYVVVCTLAKLFALAHLPLGVMPLAILLASLTCIISVPLAWLSFEFVEKPGVQLGKFVMAAWSGRPGVAPAARVTPEQSVLGER